jgi:(hydroxyamino)benzene mutase
VNLLAFAGVLLFLLGLLTGFLLPALRSPRIGLSAHLTAVQSGLALVAFGLVGARLELSPTAARVIAHALWISLYLLWLGILFAGAVGASRALPMAGAGVRAKPWQETTAFALIALPSLGVLLAVAALLWDWSWRGPAT